MNESMTLVLMQIVAILCGIIFIYIIVKNMKSYAYEKKFSSFALLSFKDTENSFFDRFRLKFLEFIKWISKGLSKISILQKHASWFNPYVKTNEQILTKGIDYISLKIVISFLFLLCYFLLVFLEYIPMSTFLAFVFLFIGYLFLNGIIAYKRSKRKKNIEKNLLKAITIMNNSFKFGKTLRQAIDIVKNDLEGPIADEFAKMASDISYGLSTEEVFNRFYLRVKIKDIKTISCLLSLSNQTGGNIVKLFSRLERTLIEKEKLREELNSLTFYTKILICIFTFFSITFIVILYLFNKEYFKPFFTSKIGLFIFAFLLLFYILYILIIRKVLKVKI